MAKKHLKVHRDGLTAKVISVLVAYAKTQLLLIVLVTFLTWLVLSWIGVEYAFLLALITGSASVVPIVGILTAAIIASLFAIFDASRFLPTLPVVFEGMVVLVLYGLMNVLIDYFLSPYLIGKSAHINPVVLLVFVLIGTSVFGLPGALLTVPAILVAKTVIEHTGK